MTAETLLSHVSHPMAGGMEVDTMPQQQNMTFSVKSDLESGSESGFSRRLNSRPSSSVSDTKAIFPSDLAAIPYAENDAERLDKHMDSNDLDHTGINGNGMPENAQSGLEDPKPEVTEFDIAALMLNKQIGTGMFTTPCAVLLSTQSKALCIALWTIEGFWTLTFLLIYPELGVTYPSNGDEPVYLDETYYKPKILSIIVFSISFLMSANSYGNAAQFAKYVLLANFPDLDDSTQLDPRLVRYIAICAITFVCLASWHSRRSGLFLEKLLAWYKIFFLLALFVVGIIMSRGEISKWGSDGSRGFITNGMTGMALILYPYQGWKNANYVAGELCNHRHRTKKTLIYGAIMGTTVTWILYVFATLAIYRVLGYEDLIGPHSDLTVALKIAPKIFGGATGIKVGMAISALGNVLAVAYTASKVELPIALQRILPFPDFLSKSNPTRKGTLLLHWITSVVFIAAAPTSSDGYSFALSLYTHGHILFSVFIAIGLVQLQKRKQRPDLQWQNTFFKFKQTLYIILDLFARMGCRMCVHMDLEPDNPLVKYPRCYANVIPKYNFWDRERIPKLMTFIQVLVLDSNDCTEVRSPRCAKRVAIHLHKQRFVCTIKIYSNWTIQESPFDDRVLYFISRPAARDRAFRASQPTSKAKYLTLAFFSNRDRESFKRKYLATKKGWDHKLQEISNTVGVNRAPHGHQQRSMNADKLPNLAAPLPFSVNTSLYHNFSVTSTSERTADNTNNFTVIFQSPDTFMAWLGLGGNHEDQPEIPTMGLFLSSPLSYSQTVKRSGFDNAMDHQPLDGYTGLPSPEMYLNAPQTSELEPEQNDFQFIIHNNLVGSPFPYMWRVSNPQQSPAQLSGGIESMTAIRTYVRDQLREQRSLRLLSRRNSSAMSDLTVNLDWNPIQVALSHGFKYPFSGVLDRLYCLTGSENEAQVTTVVDYVTKTWPNNDTALISLIRELMSKPEGQTCSYQSSKPSESKLTGVLHQPNQCLITITGGTDLVSQVVEQLGWLYSAIQLAPVNQGMVACIPKVGYFTAQSATNAESRITVVAECRMSIELRDLASRSTGRPTPQIPLRLKQFLIHGYPTLQNSGMMQKDGTGPNPVLINPSCMNSGDLKAMRLQLPEVLRNIMETTPKNSIEIHPRNDESILNKAKLWLEDYTGFLFDWRPFKAPRENMPPGMWRVEWTMFGHRLQMSTTEENALLLKDLLSVIEEHPDSCDCCIPKVPPLSLMDVINLIGNTLTFYAQSYMGIVSHANQASSSAAQKYTPSNTSPSGATNSQTTLHLRGQKNAAPAPPQPSIPPAKTASIIPPDAPQQTCHQVLFAVKGSRWSWELVPVAMTNAICDSTFFHSLRTHHRAHRYAYLHWVSPFRFKNCRCVKLDVVEPHRVLAGTQQALPDDHGQTSNYEYAPRPPNVKLPLIDPRHYLILLSECSDTCLWRLWPTHECIRLHASKSHRLKIPRRKDDIKDLLDAGEGVAFGIEADYVLSLRILAAYHLAAIVPAFVFWAFWLSKNQGDWQNASVPLLTVLALTTVFWIMAGKRVGIS